jgi:hypothetical protein
VDRTPIGKKYVDELIKVNDQLCYSALLHHEFTSVISHHAKSSPDTFTSSIFDSNPFSFRLYRKAKELPIFASHAGATGSRMAVVLGYEHVSAYLDEIQDFRAKNKPTPWDKIKEDAQEDQIFKKLVKWLSYSPPRDYFRTIGYFRHMRNSFAHGHEEASKEFASFAAKHSHSLNKFWNNGVTQLNGLNLRLLHPKSCRRT